MPDDQRAYAIRFDDRGHILIDDPDLQRRLLYLLNTDRQIVVELTGGDLPPEIDPIPLPRPRNLICPNSMCDCGALKIVHRPTFDLQWGNLGAPDAAAPSDPGIE